MNFKIKISKLNSLQTQYAAGGTLVRTMLGFDNFCTTSHAIALDDMCSALNFLNHS